MVLRPDSREITTHHTPRGPRRFTHMNYGTKSTAEIFQKEISEALDGLEGVLNISDDILVYGKDEEEHDDHVEEVLNKNIKWHLMNLKSAYQVRPHWPILSQKGRLS